MSLISMTGYATRNVDAGPIAYCLELKSVNHRYCDVRCKAPRHLASLEADLIRAVKKAIRRGRVDMMITAQNTATTSAVAVTVDEALAKQYYRAYDRIRLLLELQEFPSLAMIAKSPDVLRQGSPALDLDQIREPLLDGLAACLNDLVAMRSSEGTHLEVDVRQHLQRLRELREIAETQAPAALDAARDRLRKNTLEILGDSAKIDQNRLHQEIVILSDKLDLNEEVARLDSHCKQFESMIDQVGPHGKKLDFLLQEMNREANTIASKANFAELSQTAVAMKVAIEKIREQIQNIE